MTPINADSSLIRLRRADATFFLVATAAAAAGAAYFAGRSQLSGVIGCGLIAALMAAAPFLIGGEAFCPRCEGALIGQPLIDSLQSYSRCGGCRSYLRRESGQLRTLDDGHVAKTPQFAIPVDELRELPLLCCVCRRPACRFQDLVYTSAVRHSPGFPTDKPVAFKAAAPYCDEHFDAASLAFEDFSSFPGIGAKLFVEPEPLDQHLVLKVRSYGFYRAATLQS